MNVHGTRASGEPGRGAFRRAPDLLERRCGDHVLVLPLGSREVVELSGTACDLWALLAEPHALGALEVRLRAHYAGDSTAIERDVRHALDLLVENGVVTTC